MKKMCVALLLTLVACTNEEKAARALQAQGYTSISFTGYRITGCSDDDEERTGFAATAPSGVHVTGVVCSGFGPFGKCATVRLD